MVSWVMALENQPEVTRIPCPNCNFEFDPVELAKKLPNDVLIAERARRNGLRTRRRVVAGPGRPKDVARCPSCPGIFTLAQFRDHLLPCLTAKLKDFQSTSTRIQVSPMDSTEYRDFHVGEIRSQTVTLHKLSNMQQIEIPLRSIREITPQLNDRQPLITLRGSLRWNNDIQRWWFFH